MTTSPNKPTPREPSTNESLKKQPRKSSPVNLRILDLMKQGLPMQRAVMQAGYELRAGKLPQ